jgi:hypothetical protein
MSLYYRTGAFMYGNPGTWLFTDAPKEPGDTDTEQAERYDQVASNGARVSYFVGERRFIERVFRFQSDALLAQWRTFWREHAGRGKEFWYYEDTPPIYGTGDTFGDAGLVYGGSVAGVLVRAEQTDFRPEPEEVAGYWAIQLTMRRLP